MSCGKDAEQCKRKANSHGQPEATAMWAAGREGGGHCPECGGFLTREGVCHNPHCWEFRGASARDLEKAGYVLHRPDPSGFDKIRWLRFAGRYGLVRRLCDDRGEGQRLLPINRLPDNSVSYVSNTPAVFVFKPEDKARIEAVIAAWSSSVTRVSPDDFLTGYATAGDGDMLVAQTSETGFAVATGGRKVSINRQHLLWVMNQKSWYLTDKEQRDLGQAVRHLFAQDAFPEREEKSDFWYVDDSFKILGYNLGGRHCPQCEQMIVNGEKCPTCAGPNFEALREHYRKTTGKRAGAMLDKSGPGIERLANKNYEAWYLPEKKQWFYDDVKHDRHDRTVWQARPRQKLTKTEADYMRYLHDHLNAARRNIRQVKVVDSHWYPKGRSSITPNGISYLRPLEGDVFDMWHAGRNIRLPKQAVFGERDLTASEKLDVAYFCFSDLEDVDSFDAGPLLRQLREGLNDAD